MLLLLDERRPLLKERFRELIWCAATLSPRSGGRDRPRED